MYESGISIKRGIKCYEQINFNIIASMKHQLTLALHCCLVTILALLQSCGGKYDNKGRLLVESLTSSSGTFHFSPMMHSDSASVETFKPDTFLLRGNPYTGGVAQYNAQNKLMMEGFLSNGLMDSSWKFYFPSGGIHIEGKYKNGMETGLWRSYYGYDKPKIDKLYDDYGYMLMRAEYYDNGQLMNYENIKHPLFDNKERKIEKTRKGELVKIFVEDSVLMLKQGETAERIGKNIFATHSGQGIPVASQKQ
jgi:hypothetical protein